jgi:two-component system, NtrC family, sensor kinase
MNVLVADDDPVFQKLLPGLLKSWGYDVTVARDGEEAWEYLHSDDGLRLAIVDWIMPGVDGLELCRRIRSARRSNYVYILLMTAKKDSSGLLTVMEAGADDYVTKPFDTQELKLRLRAGCRVLESEERYRVIAQTASDGILTTDETGRIQFANTAAATIFGFTSADLVDRDFESLAPGSLGRGDSVADYGHANSAIELTGKHRTGREIPLEISVSECLQGPQNHRLTVVIRDITERRRTERQVALSQKLESIGQLAAGVAHEINTPIQYVGDNLNFLSDSWNSVFRILAAYQELPCSIGPEVEARKSPESIAWLSEELDIDYLRMEIPKAIQQSLDGVRRVAEIVGAMKELSHPGSAVKAAVDLNHAIKNTIVVSKNAWKYVADLTTDLDAELPAVQCIAGDIHQVMLNLIINAADAISDRHEGNGHPKGQIVVRTRHEGDWVEIRVCDTGMGIPEIIQPRIFDPFFTTKGVGKGTGQGLAIAHAIIVQKHQGSIQFETQKGTGTTFVIRLPIGTDEAASQARTPDSLEAKYAG